MLGMGRPGEVNELAEWFMSQERSASDPKSCHFAIRVDDSNTCDGLFFMSMDMKTSFGRNGQFLIMDATCKTNRFGMQLVLLVGSNQILRTCIFGMALIATESAESYIWLLGEARKAVGTMLSHLIRPSSYTVAHFILRFILHFVVRSGVHSVVQPCSCVCGWE